MCSTYKNCQKRYTSLWLYLGHCKVYNMVSRESLLIFNVCYKTLKKCKDALLGYELPFNHICWLSGNNVKFFEFTANLITHKVKFASIFESIFLWSHFSASLCLRPHIHCFICKVQNAVSCSVCRCFPRWLFWGKLWNVTHNCHYHIKLSS